MVDASGSYLTTQGYNAAALGVGLTAAAAVVASAVVGPETGTMAAVGTNFLLAAAADPIATRIRHGENTRDLAWLRLVGRGGHIPVVATGLALTFGGAVEPVIEGAKHLFGGGAHDAAQDLFLRLAIGIQPMAVVATAAAPQGKRVATFFAETLLNVTGSALATLGLPLWDHTVHAVAGEPGGLLKGLAAQAHYIVGYLTVLAARGYADLPGAVEEEIAAGKRPTEAA